jgi:hypothetical protein
VATTDGPACLQQRIEKLESRIRWFERGGIFVIALFASLWLMGQNTPVQPGVTPPPQATPAPAKKRPAAKKPTPAPAAKTVEASEFVLKDKAGKVRGRFTVTEAGPELVLVGEDGRERLKLAQDAQSAPSLTLLDDHGKTRVRVGFTAQAASVLLFDGNGKKRTALVEAPASGLALYDADEKERAALVMDESAAAQPALTPRLIFNDPTGNPSESLGLAADGPQLNLFGANQALSASFALRGGVPRLALSQPSGELRATVDADGPMLGMLDTRGKLRAAIAEAGDSARIVIADASGNTRAAMNQDSIEVIDQEGGRASIGATSLSTGRKGEGQRTSAATIVLSDKDRRVVWKAP